MKLGVFSAWAVGPDVGINIERTPEEVGLYQDACFIPLDFSVAEARDLATQLNRCADLAEADARAYHEHMKEAK